ncbi:hypothetical protein Tco_1504273 [Tanacetum coccineum]
MQVRSLVRGLRPDTPPHTLSKHNGTDTLSTSCQWSRQPRRRHMSRQPRRRHGQGHSPSTTEGIGKSIPEAGEQDFTSTLLLREEKMKERTGNQDAIDAAIEGRLADQEEVNSILENHAEGVVILSNDDVPSSKFKCAARHHVLDKSKSEICSIKYVPSLSKE